MIGHVRRVAFGHVASVKGVLEIVRDEIARLEQQVGVVRGAALHVVGGGAPGRVLGARPVQFGQDLAAELVDRGGDAGVDVGPGLGGVGGGVLVEAFVVVARVFGVVGRGLVFGRE